MNQPGCPDYCLPTAHTLDSEWDIILICNITLAIISLLPRKLPYVLRIVMLELLEKWHFSVLNILDCAKFLSLVRWLSWVHIIIGVLLSRFYTVLIKPLHYSDHVK